MHMKFRAFALGFFLSLAAMLLAVFIIKADFESGLAHTSLGEQQVFAVTRNDEGERTVILFNRELTLPDFLQKIFSD